MVCGQCGKEGHNRAACPEPPPPLTSIILPADVCEKLAVLQRLCVEVASLGKGHVEGVYQQALATELQDAGIKYMMEEPMPILYKGRPLGGGHHLRLDVVLYSYLPFIYELKAVSKICPEHHWQVVRYMIYKDKPYGAVVNFTQSERGQLQIQFIVRHEGAHWLYDPASQTGQPLVDYSLID